MQRRINFNGGKNMRIADISLLEVPEQQTSECTECNAARLVEANLVDIPASDTGRKNAFLAGMDQSLREWFGIYPDEEILSASCILDRLPFQKLPPDVVFKQLTDNFRRPVRAALADDDKRDLGLYDALFGRDSLEVAKLEHDTYPQIAEQIILSLAQLQGYEYYAASEEEPGKILHEYRETTEDPIALELIKKAGWRFPYFGSDDATPDWIRLLIAHCRRPEIGKKFLDMPIVNRQGDTVTLQNSLDAALGWIENRLSNEYGVIITRRRSLNTHENPVWKDSPDSSFHSDGTIVDADAPKVLIDIQHKAYDALMDAAEYFEQNGDEEHRARAVKLREQAQRLRQNIQDKFWVDKGEKGFYAHGLELLPDGTFKRMDVRTSNMGHLLNSRLLEGNDPETVRRREAMIRSLFSFEMLNASGIRSAAMDEKVFRPNAYHNGTVWLWDSYEIARGLHHQGYHQLGLELEKRVWWTVQKYGYVEYAAGYNSREPLVNSCKVIIKQPNGKPNTIVQPPQLTQAWTVAAYDSIVHDLKGMASSDTYPSTNREFEEAILADVADRPENLHFCQEYGLDHDNHNMQQIAATLLEKSVIPGS